ncbi:MAG: glycosyltransferase [Gammaproteobacteria bacterium]|nr:glycosyltransferase [Gammaproteobacteria bacterium]
MLYTLARTLHRELNTQVSVVLLNHGILEQKLRNCGIPVHVLDESQLSSFQILRRLNRIIVDVNPNVIHTHRSKENILGSIAAWYKHHIPSLRTVHGAPEHRPPLHKPAKHLILFLDWLSGRYLQQTIIAVSPDLAHKLEHSFPKTKIKVIENGIDIDATIHGVSSVNSKDSNKNNYRIGIAGRLVPVKRVDLFIESAFYLKQHHPEINIDFYIYGDGPLNNALQAQIESLQANDYIHLNGHCENMTQQLQMLDALLMTSDHEGLPMVLLEAMCLKIPIIAHAVGGIPHLLNNGKRGTLIHNHCAEAFAEAIVTLIDQPQQFQQLAQLAFDRVKQNYSARSAADGYLDIYKKLSTG